jgi:hypothetical protein
VRALGGPGDATKPSERTGGSVAQVPEPRPKIGAQVPEPVSPTYRTRVRKVSCSYRSQSGVELPDQRMGSESGRRESNPRSQLGKPFGTNSLNWQNQKICR